MSQTPAAPHNPKLSIVTGAGPVGWSVAEALAAAGTHVRVLTRSASGPDHPLIEKVATDVSDPAQLAAAFEGAGTVFHCIHASAYTAKAWAAQLPQTEQTVMDAAAAADAVVVFPESLYSYNQSNTVMTEDGPRAAQGGKRGIRTELLKARTAHPANTVSVVAGDFFGPRVKVAHAGDRMVPRILAGKALNPLGSADQPHSFTYVPDLAAAMVAVANRPELWNTVLHAPTGPALTQRELAKAFASAAGVPLPTLRVIPGWMVRSGGLVSTDLREIGELLYQFTKPFVMDSSRSEALLGFKATAFPDAAAATVAWWKSAA
ncbi:NAD-dependent epimerase/dehydratase family protein [Pseudarthrobacter sp. J1738]|uniref:NAD-dependent epimerase/dehydratase family protein n=1 Tax=unclassified Pseudarthrobacter TaxID=2647000 RepID=UPI003D2B72DC